MKKQRRLYFILEIAFMALFFFIAVAIDAEVFTEKWVSIVCFVLCLAAMSLVAIAWLLSILRESKLPPFEGDEDTAHLVYRNKLYEVSIVKEEGTNMTVSLDEELGEVSVEKEEPETKEEGKDEQPQK